MSNSGRLLSYGDARAAYNRIGRIQDLQAAYEDLPVKRLLGQCDLPAANRIFEIGCGTGRLAKRVLSGEFGDIPSAAQYRGIDVSPVMVRLATERLRGFGDRADAELADGKPTIAAESDSFDLILSTYVFDLLSGEDVRCWIDEAQRVLRPGGELAMTSLAEGVTTPSKIFMGGWRAIHRVAPALLGGCRPVDTRGHLQDDRWRLTFQETVVSRYLVPSEVLVAQAVGG